MLEITHHNNWKKFKINKLGYHYIIFHFSSKNKKVCIIDCGLKFDPYILSNFAREEKKDIDLILRNVYITRAFNLHHLKTSLERLKNFDYLFILNIDSLLEDRNMNQKEKDIWKNTLIDILSALKINIFFVFDGFAITNQGG